MKVDIAIHIPVLFDQLEFALRSRFQLLLVLVFSADQQLFVVIQSL